MIAASPCRSTAWSGRSTCPRDVDEARIRDQRQRRPRAPACGHGRGRCAPWSRRSARCRGVRIGARPVPAAASMAASTDGNCFVRIAPHEERIFSLRPPVAGDPGRHPLRRLPGQLPPARRDAGGARTPCASSRTCASAVRNIPSFNIGGGNFDIDFAIRGPDLEALAALRRGPAQASPRLGGILDADITPQARQAGAARAASTATRAADLGVDAARHRHRAAADGGRRRGGLALPRRLSQRRLRRAAPAQPRRPRRPAAIIAALRAAATAAGWCGSTTWSTS